MQIQTRRWAVTYFGALSLALGALSCGSDGGSNGSNSVAIESFTATPSKLSMHGETSKLAWKVKNATSVTIRDGSGNELVSKSDKQSGDVTTAPIHVATTFTLTAEGEGGPKTKDVTVTIETSSTDPSITSFTATPTKVKRGAVSKLAWVATNVDSIEIAVMGAATPLHTSSATRGDFDVTPSETTTYVLTAKKGDKSATANVVVSVPAPTVNTFTATPQSVDPGASSTLAWNVDLADTIVVTDSAQNEVYSGSVGVHQISVTPAATETYTLVATNAVGNSARVVTVNVNEPGLPVIDSFRANPSTISLNDSSRLEWTVSGPGDITITISRDSTELHHSTSRMGTFDVRPGVTTVYVLTAENSAGEVTQATTVTVNRDAPTIAGFSANPNPTKLFGSTTLSWTTSRADSVRIRNGATEIYTSTVHVGTGTFEVGMASTSTVFTLEARNDAGVNTWDLSVYAEDVPVIGDFDIAPRSFTGSSTTATITWSVSNVKRLRLTANGAAVQNFPALNVATATDSAGAISTEVTQTTRFVLTAETAGGTAEATIIVFEAFDKTEVGDTATTAIALAGDGSGVNGTIQERAVDDPRGTDRDYYAITVPEGGSVEAETSDGQGECDMDTILTLTSTNGDALETDDDTGFGSCSRIDPRVDAGARNLAAGTYYIVVRGYENAFSSESATGSYTLQVIVRGPSCGNAIVEDRIGEFCDDGNTETGDGCDAACHFEPAGTLTGPGATSNFANSIAGASDPDYFRIDMQAEGYISAEIFVPTEGECAGGARTTLTLLDANLDVIGDDADDGIGGCSRIDPEFDEFAKVEAGTYWVRVGNDRGGSAIADYVLVVDTLGVGCGNGIRETTTAIDEFCDDGNTSSGDGCSNVCQFEGSAEVEPNDDYAHAAPMAAPSTSQGALLVDANDAEDWYSIVVSDRHSIDALLTVNSFTSCPAEPRAVLTLFDVDGATELASDDNNGPHGNCGWLAPANDKATIELPGGTYFLRVSSKDLGEIESYFLHVSLIAPGCGNSIKESDEACDDGNTIAGDGCSDTCGFEPDHTFEAIAGATATISDSLMLDPNGVVEVDVVEIVVTSTIHVNAATFTDAAAGTCVDTDTVIALVTATGEVIAGSDDVSFAWTCSKIHNTTHPDARLGPGTYYLLITGYYADVAIDAYDLVLSTFSVNVCGNGVVEEANGEECDDGNLADGDLCSSTCTPTCLPGFECEPNGTPETATAIGLVGTGTVTLAASMDWADDVDYFGFTIAAGQTFDVTTNTHAEAADPNSRCAFGVSDTVMDLYVDNGTATPTLLLSNDDASGLGVCSRIDAAALGEGIYYVAVREYAGELIDAYFLTVAFE